MTGRVVVETKEKIKLLADLQSAIDNEELKELVEGLPSGEKIFQIFQAALNAELQQLLSGKTDGEAFKEQEFSDLIKTLDQSMVLSVLRSINDKLNTTSATETRPVASQSSQEPGEPPPNQEELERQWKEQQYKQSSLRGASTGIF